MTLLCLPIRTFLYRWRYSSWFLWRKLFVVSHPPFILLVLASTSELYTIVLFLLSSQIQPYLSRTSAQNFQQEFACVYCSLLLELLDEMSPRNASFGSPCTARNEEMWLKQTFSGMLAWCNRTFAAFLFPPPQFRFCLDNSKKASFFCMTTMNWNNIVLATMACTPDSGWLRPLQYWHNSLGGWLRIGQTASL